MPVYQCRCTACDEELETVQKFSDPVLTICPACNDDLRKVYSAVGVVFKGSGFYATDSRGSTLISKSVPGSEVKTDSVPAESTEIAKTTS